MKNWNTDMGLTLTNTRETTGSAPVRMRFLKATLSPVDMLIITRWIPFWYHNVMWFGYLKSCVWPVQKGLPQYPTDGSWVLAK